MTPTTLAILSALGSALIGLALGVLIPIPKEP